MSQTISISIWLTSSNLLSSPTLPNRYVRPSHCTSSKAMEETNDECPWHRAITRCSHGEMIVIRSSCPPVYDGTINLTARGDTECFLTHQNKPAIRRPRHTSQASKIRRVGINQSGMKVSHGFSRWRHEHGYFSDNASMIRKHPSSDTAAT